jgi:hypothetical protein
MLSRDDILELPDGVTVAGGVLRDECRAVSVPVNSAAAVVLTAGDRPLEEIAAVLAERFDLPHGRAIDDVLHFAWQLNGIGLVNVRRGVGPFPAIVAWLRLAARLVPAGALPPLLTRRVSLDTSNTTGAVLSTARHLAPRALLLALLCAVAVLQGAAIAGRAPLVLSACFGLGVGGALVLHEAGHVIAVGRASPAAILLNWKRISILHRPLSPGRNAVVALAGPLAATLVGLGLAAVAASFGISDLALAAAPLAGHAIGLTVATTDGRQACGI